MPELSTTGAVIKPAYEGECVVGEVAVTIAPSGGDFVDFEEFCDWLIASRFINAHITVTVEGGATYTSDWTGRSSVMVSSGMGITRLEFLNDGGGDYTDTIIQFENVTGRVFDFLNASVWMSEITVEMVDSPNGRLFESINSDIEMFDFRFVNGGGINFYGGILYADALYTEQVGADHTIQGAPILFFSAAIAIIYALTADADDSDSSVIALFAMSGAEVTLTGDVVLRGFLTALAVQDGGRIRIDTLLDTTGTTNVSTAMNVFRGDGGYITDGDLNVGVAQPLNNFAATADPAVGDDDADGYAIGSWWLNITAQRLFHCENASTGAAVWLPIYGHAAVRVVSGTSDTVLATDSGGVIVYTNAAAIAVTLPNTFPLNFQFTVIQTTAAGIPTVTRSGSDTINGAATGVAPSAQWKGAYFVQHAANAWICLK